MYLTTIIRVGALMCQGTDVSGYNHVWAQIKCVWAQSCLGTVVWAQSCMGTNVVEPKKMPSRYAFYLRAAIGTNVGNSESNPSLTTLEKLSESHTELPLSTSKQTSTIIFKTLQV